MLHENNCPIIRQTGDGTPVGRCWQQLDEMLRCPIHGDVSRYRRCYTLSGGRLTPENDMRKDRKDRGESLLGK